MKQKYTQLNKTLFLVQQPIQKDKDLKKASQKINHIFIYDRSGSMSYVLNRLCDDLKDKIRSLPMNDTVSIAYFSGPSEHNFIVKGYKITGAEDFKILENAIDKNNRTIGSTCFSEVLQATNKVIEDLTVISNVFNLVFFTDGCPTVYPYNVEVEKIHSAIEKINGKIASSLLIGYGEYYNKALMSEMAQKFGGGLVHARDLAQFNSFMASFLKDSRENDGKIEIDLLPVKGLRNAVFSLSGQQINVYPNSENKIAFSPSKKDQDYIYTLQSEAPKDGEKVEFTDVNVRGKSAASESLVKAAYSAAYILTQQTKTDQALEVLSTLGDKALIDAVNNSFTNSEYGKAEEKIRDAAFNPESRFLQGRNTKYLPAADAFCLLDVVDILLADDEAKFYPYNDKFSYNKIGVSSKAKSEYPKFDADKDSACNLSTLVWNKEYLNLSILASIKGTVNLIGDAKKVGLAEVYPTNIFRTYTLVKDGYLNISSIPVSLSKNSFNKLKENGLIDDEYSNGGVFELFLNRVPVINRSIADGKTSAKALCEKAYKEITLKSKMKAFNYFKEQLQEKVTKTFGALTSEQEDFLAKNGIVRGSYNPPSVKEASTDFYYAKEFTVKIAKHSTIPKVEEAITAAANLNLKGAKGKPLTATQKLVNDGVEEYNKVTANLSDDKVKLAAVESLIGKTKTELLSISSDIQKTKFAILLGKKWFDEFTSREDNVLTLGDKEFTIGVREVKVDI